MSQRCPNPRLAKIHQNYTVEEISRLYSVHRNTVRQWIKQGLPLCDDGRPQLILGRDLKDFLTRKRSLSKRSCGPGEIYCVRCRLPRFPALAMADYQPLTASTGNLVALCPECGGLMFRRVNFGKLASVAVGLDVQIPAGAEVQVARDEIHSLAGASSKGRGNGRPAQIAASAPGQREGLAEILNPSVNCYFKPGA